ncbi:MAG: hypothetical protein ACFB9N_15610 [Geitlerinemataceae cyanobacterium]
MMNTFKQNLKYIENWLERNNRESYFALEEGLEADEFPKYLDDLDFSLPKHFYDLYEWRNGMEWYDNPTYGMSPYRLIPGYTFNSLEASLEIHDAYFEIVREIFEYEARETKQGHSSHYGIVNCCFLPILTLDHRTHIFLLGNNREDGSYPLVYIAFDDGLSFCFDSLSGMISTFFECFKSGAYYTQQRPSGEVELRQNSEACRQIERRFNPICYRNLS